MSPLRPIDSLDERRALLDVARATVEAELGIRKGAPTETCEVGGRFGGAFVTLWGRGKALRGCVGTFVPTEDICATVQDMTRKSLADSRFAASRVTAKDLADLDIEISILSDAGPTSDPLSLIPGTHGIVIRRGHQSGCFLPKVASERGWSAEEFLSNCCTMKAGLPAEAWRKDDTEVLLLTAQVFAESQIG